MTLSFGITLETKIGSRTEFEIEKLISNMSSCVPDTQERQLTHILTFAKSTSYTSADGLTVNNTCADGKAIVATDHPLRGSSLTYSTATGDPEFSVTALETVEKAAIETSYDNLGNVVNLEFDTIITTQNPTLVNAVNVLLNSTANTGDNKNSNVTNPYRSRFKHVVLPMLDTTADGQKDTSKTKAWGLCASKYTDITLLEQQGAKAMFEHDYDVETQTDLFVTTAMFGTGIITPKARRLCFPS